MNCVMDRATLDAVLDDAQLPEACVLRARKEVGGHDIKLSRKQFIDLISVHLGDWLQQACSSDRRCHQCRESLMYLENQIYSLSYHKLYMICSLVERCG